MGVFKSRSRKNGNKGELREPSLFASDGRQRGAAATGDAEPAGGRRRKSRRGAGTGSGRKPRRKRSWLLRAFYWSVTLAVWGVVGVVGVLAYFMLALPNDTLFKLPDREPGIVLLADDGQVMAERGSFSGDDIRYDELPRYVPQAVMSIEDRRFFQHFGVDPIGLARAAYTNFRAGGVVQGGSTLTQQLAKNLFLEPDRTFERKIQEVVLALWLEYKFSKEEILQLYLNRVYFGSGAYGVEAAAKRYFGKSVSEVSLAEAAILAGLLKAPSNYNPITKPKAAEDRAYVVLNAMVDEKYITQKQGQQAIDNPAAVVGTTELPSSYYVADWVIDMVPNLIGEHKESLIIETSIDLSTQNQAEAVLRKQLAGEGAKFGAQQGAMVVMDASGGVKAMVGGRSYSKSQYNRAVKAKRQPGSAFKPFVYLAAMEHGLTPNSVLVDEPVRFGDWTPENYSRKYMGPVTLREALSKSLNTIAAKLAVQVGPQSVIETAQRMGIQSTLVANASIGLGTSEVSLLELTAAYAPFANGGFRVAPFVINRIVTKTGKVLYQRLPTLDEQVISDLAVGEMNDMLRSAIVEGTAKRAALDGQDAAGKTGTSQNFRDAWFVGYTPHLIAGVWVGNDDNSPTKKASGSGLPATIWQQVMTSAHAGLPALPLPGEAYVAESEQQPYDDYGGQQNPQMVGRDSGPSIENVGNSIANFFDGLFGGRSNRAAPQPPQQAQPNRQQGSGGWNARSINQQHQQQQRQQRQIDVGR